MTLPHIVIAEDAPNYLDHYLNFIAANNTIVAIEPITADTGRRVSAAGDHHRAIGDRRPVIGGQSGHWDRASAHSSPDDKLNTRTPKKKQFQDDF